MLSYIITLILKKTKLKNFDFHFSTLWDIRTKFKTIKFNT